MNEILGISTFFKNLLSLITYDNRMDEPYAIEADQDPAIVAAEIRAKFKPEDLLTDEIGIHIPLKTEGDIIRADLAFFDEKFDEALKTLEERTWIPYLTDKDIHTIKRDLRLNFSTYGLEVPGLTDDPPASRSRSNQTFAMISPNDRNASLADRMIERAKWEAIRDALEDGGAKIEVMDNSLDTDSGREVFTRDKFLTIGTVAYIPDIKAFPVAYPDWNNADPQLLSELMDTYKTDIDQSEDFLTKQGYEIIRVEGAWFEGGNIIQHQNANGNILFFGLEPFNDSNSLAVLMDAVNRTQNETWSGLGVPLNEYYAVDGKIQLYHLDLGMSPQLPKGETILYPGITDPDTYERIRAILGEENIIEIDYNETALYATNLNFANDRIVMTGASDALITTLQERGYEVITAKDYGLENFEISLGGVHCMTNEIEPIASEQTNTQALTPSLGRP